MSRFDDVRLLDFRNFLYLTWRKLGLPNPTRAQYAIADALQNVVRPLLGLNVRAGFADRYPSLWEPEKAAPTDRMILQAFRGIGKSWIVSTLVVWCLKIRPDLNILVSSAGKVRSDAFSTFTLRLIAEIEEIGDLAPNPKSGQRYSNVAFDVGPAPPSHAPSVFSMGIMGQLTGSRADIIIADDVEVPNNSETQTMREKLRARTKEFSAIVKPEGVIIYLGTPQCEDSLYNDLASRGYRRYVWPSRYPSPKLLELFGGAFDKSLADDVTERPEITTGFGLDGTRGAPTDPERFSEEDLIARETEYGRSGFDLQFQLDTTLSDADRYRLKLADLIVMDLDPKVGPEHPVWASGPEYAVQGLPVVGLRGDRYHRPAALRGGMVEYTGCLMAVDPAGRGRDELAYAVVKHYAGFLFLVDSGGLLGGYTPENLAHIAACAARWGVNRVVCEPNYGGGMFTELLKPVMARVHPCLVEETEWSRAQKERRIIDTLEPVMNSHRLVVSRQVILSDSRRTQQSASDSETDVVLRQLFYQMTRITSEKQCLKFDDRLDALALAVAEWTKSVAQDADKVRTRREDRLTVERLRETLRSRVRTKTNSAFPPKKPNFFNKF